MNESRTIMVGGEERRRRHMENLCWQAEVRGKAAAAAQGDFARRRNPEANPEAYQVTTSELPCLLERVQKLSRKKQGAPPFIAASPPPPHAMLRGCGAVCACFGTAPHAPGCAS